MRTFHFITKHFIYLLFLSLVIAPASVYGQSVDWTGAWDSNWRTGGARLHLLQKDGKVAGTYEPYDGQIVATVDGRILKGEWIEKKYRGEFLFTMSPDGETFIGRFDSGEWWNGGRVTKEASVDFNQVDFSAPREVLKDFLLAFNQVREGQYQFASLAVSCLDFGDQQDKFVAGEKLQVALSLFDVLDQLTIRLWSLPGSIEDDVTQVRLTQSGTDVDFKLNFRKNTQGQWRIVAPETEELKAKFSALISERGIENYDPKGYLKLKNPRDTIRTFSEQYKRWSLSGRDHVIRTLDLSQIDESVRELEAPLLAEYLEYVLNRISFIIWQEIPNDPDNQLPYVYFAHPKGNIVVAPVQTEDGIDWKFTAETLQNIRELYNAFEDMPLVEGVKENANKSVFFKLRDGVRKVSPALISRSIVLENWQWVAIFLIVFVGLLAGVCFGYFIDLLVKKKFKEGHVKLDRKLEFQFIWPLRMLLMAAVWYSGFFVIGLPEDFLKILGALSLSLVVIGGTWAAYNLTGLIGEFLSQKAKKTRTYVDDILISIITSTVKIVLLIVGMILLAECLSIQYRTLLAGIGISGIAIAVAAKDSLSNFFGSTVLVTDRPFKKGDLVRISDRLGYVAYVGIRSTHIRTLDDSLMVIPNSILSNEIIENLQKRRKRHVNMRISVTYDTPPKKLDAFAEGIRKAVVDHPKGIEKDLHVGVWEFAASSIDLDLFCYLDAKTREDEYVQRHRLIVDIVRLSEKMGIEFAFPTRTLYMQTQASDSDKPKKK